MRSNKGYLLEVDISYPRDLQDSHNDLPFMCERMKINGVEKLVPNIHGKQKYIIHIRVLDQALAHGLILECIHRAIEFDQSAWMKSYIDINELRARPLGGKLLHGIKTVNFYYGDDHKRVPNIRIFGGMKVVKGKFG